MAVWKALRISCPFQRICSSTSAVLRYVLALLLTRIWSRRSRASFTHRLSQICSLRAPSSSSKPIKACARDMNASSICPTQFLVRKSRPPKYSIFRKNVK